MAKPRSVTDEERARIVDSLRGGKMSQAKIAKEFGRGVATISRIANSEGIDTERSATEKATKTRERYDEAERREVLNAGFDKARVLLDQLEDAAEFQKWTVGVGTLLDKIRLDSGEATGRLETTRYDGNSDREQRFERLFGQLDAYRASQDEGDGGSDPSVPMDPDSAELPPT